MRPIRQSYIPTALDADAIALSQTPGAAGALTLSGANVVNGVAVLGAAQYITVTSAANLSARTFTITGTDSQGRARTVTLTGPNATTVATTVPLNNISSITIDAAAAGALTVGVNGQGFSPVIPLDYNRRDESTAIAVVISGSPTYTLQHTFDDVQSAAYDPATGTWFDHDDATMNAATTNQNGNFVAPCTGCRVLLASSSGGVITTVIQQGV